MMALSLSADVLNDEMAVSLARALAVANAEARSRGVDVEGSSVSITRTHAGSSDVWRINYGPADFSQRGGDFRIDVDTRTAAIRSALLGQ